MNCLSMRSILGRPFLNVAKETMFDSGQLDGHLADDWALELRLVVSNSDHPSSGTD